MKNEQASSDEDQSAAGMAKQGPPRLALALGWAGVLPFAALSLSIAFGLDLPAIEDPAAALVAYGAIILSFMAGVHWGLAMRAPDAPDGRLARRLLVLSVVPSIIAWFATLAPAGIAIAILALMFVGLLPLDLWAITQRLAPAWYRPLRLQLTAAVVGALAIAAVSI